MKSEISHNIEKEREIEFPYLISYEKKVVLIIGYSSFYGNEYGRGTVVHQGDDDHHLGETRDDWAISRYTKFNGTVTLSND